MYPNNLEQSAWNCQNSDHHSTDYSSSKDTSLYTWLITHRTFGASDSLVAEELRRYIN